jgi:prepilin-type N-terminal cleavage/methylation domain-containing protein
MIMQINNQKAFSLIELIFVIIITGILAAVAIPKLAGMSASAHLSNIKSFTGTLNRSVGPSLWLNIISHEPSKNGSVQRSTNYNKISAGEEVVEIPSTFAGLGEPASISLLNCMESNTTVPDINSPVGGLTAGKVAGTIAVGDTTYALGCIDSNFVTSPKFYLYDEVEGVIVY